MKSAEGGGNCTLLALIHMEGPGNDLVNLARNKKNASLCILALIKVDPRRTARFENDFCSWVVSWLHGSILQRQIGIGSILD